MNRRALLGSVNAVLLTLAGGCLGSVQDAVHSSFRLGTVRLNNHDATPHRFHVQISRDKEVVHESTHEIRAQTDFIIPSVELEQTWGQTTGSYVLRGRVDDTPWVEQAVDDALDGAPTCASAEGVYDDSGLDEFEWYVRAKCEW